jgi:two-component system nitrogen regulation response regulator GlnG
MPPLRDRTDDIPQIVDFCLQNLVKERKTRVSKVSPETIEVMLNYDWPGNVRELENVVYRSAVIAQGDAILPKDLPPEINRTLGTGVSAPGSGGVPVETATPSEETEAEVSEEPSATGSLTLKVALDFLHDELSQLDPPILNRLEEEMVKRALTAASGNQVRAAERLGMTRTTLRKRIEAYGLKP